MVFGPEHPRTLTSINNLAWLFQDLGMFKDAEELSRRVLDGREKTLGLDHPDSLKSDFGVTGPAQI